MYNRKEVKYIQKVVDLDIWMNSYDNYSVDADANNPGGYGRWLCLGFNPDEPDNKAALYSSPTGAGGTGYNSSPFALVVPQGVGTQERVGRDISVMRDEWFFRLSFPLALPGVAIEGTQTTSEIKRATPQWCDVDPILQNGAYNFGDGQASINVNVGQRPVRVRLVGIFQSVLDRPGEFGFTVSELFNSVNEINSRFNKHDARGYKIVYDKTKTFYPQPGYVTLAAGATPSASPARASAQKFDVSFSAAIPSYLRRYEAVNGPDNTTGSEVYYDAGTTTVTGGISMGAISWYMYVEDKFASMQATDATVDTGYNHYTPNFCKLEVNRKTLWTDS